MPLDRRSYYEEHPTVRILYLFDVKHDAAGTTLVFPPLLTHGEEHATVRVVYKYLFRAKYGAAG